MAMIPRLKASLTTMTSMCSRWSILTVRSPVLLLGVPKVRSNMSAGFVYSQTTDRLWRKNRQTQTGTRCVGMKTASPHTRAQPELRENSSVNPSPHMQLLFLKADPVKGEISTATGTRFGIFLAALRPIRVPKPSKVIDSMSREDRPNSVCSLPY